MGFSSRFSTVAVALLSSTLFLQETLSQLTECLASSSGFDYEVTLGTDFEVRWTVNTADETISFEVFSPAEAWISVGFSADGEMVGSDAVIGLPSDDAVTEYDLNDQDVDFVVASDEQEITGGTVTQDATGTTLTFTRPLAPAGSGKETLSATPGDGTTILFAFGSDNELAFHGVDNRGGAQLDLFCGDDAGSESGVPTAPPSTLEPSTPAPSTLEPSTAPPSTLEPSTPAPSTLEPSTAAPSTLAPLTEDETPAPSLAGGSTATAAPTAMPAGASEAPSMGASEAPAMGEEDSEEDATRDTDTDTDAAFRINGGLWAAAATVATAMLGAAMAV